MVKIRNLRDREPLSYGARAKRRGESQRVGKAGQLLFERWALDQGLVANACSDDFGIDYFCQVLLQLSTEVEEVRGDVFGVQVRSVKAGSHRRIVLDKYDAETALRLECPYLLVAVHVQRRSVRFRFLDSAFAERLADFITAPEKHLTLGVDGNDFQTRDFKRLLERNSNPGVQHRLRLRCVELCIQREIPGARLKVSHDADTGIALVEVPWISSAFRAEPGHEDTLRSFIFDRGEMPPAGTPGISLQPSLFRAIDVAGADKLLLAGHLERRSLGYVERDNKRIPLEFRVRRSGNTLAFISESGLILTQSDRTQVASGDFIHETGFRLSAEYGRTLDQFGDLDAAIRLFGPGAKIGFRSDEGGMDISVWGNDLQKLGDAYQQIIDAFAFASLPLSTTQLSDLSDEEFTRSIAVLAEFANGTTLPEILPHFLVGPAASDQDYENRLSPCRYEVPIVMNVKSLGVAVWMSGSGRTYLSDDGIICGLFADEQTACRVEVRKERFEKKWRTPEVWVAKFWPAIPLLKQLKPVDTWKGGIQHALDGRVWPVDSGEKGKA